MSKAGYGPFNWDPAVEPSQYPLIGDPILAAYGTLTVPLRGVASLRLGVPTELGQPNVTHLIDLAKSQ